MLTKKNLDEHNRQSRLCADLDSSLKLCRQQFERFRETAGGLGIDLSNHAFAAMWQGLNGLTPMERFIVGKNNPLEAKGTSEKSRKDSQTE